MTPSACKRPWKVSPIMMGFRVDCERNAEH
jgi:hypothetical protein